jgi:predicted GTPase
MEYYEQICKAFTEGTDEFRAAVLDLLDENDKATFLMAVGLYKLTTNEQFYHDVQNAIGQRAYNEFRH